ncbi:Superfamily II DNA and RNA helicase [Gaiella occulta]|uniref:Superfamily II DNA and RNA helicase n=1 Tax=Gaiella occulta TaxID=1002870 RepID=A0A7M2YXK7_9ACTN|nr:DEAD/DEAH box helicase [Gaiella occulta]RDI74786.1 Superfamily II DNA and RNA helicase [Gaiella occulta]
MSQHTFAALGLHADIVGALAEQGIESPFQIQTRAIPAALSGADILAKAPTGSGKTLAFAVPIVQHVTRDGARPAALILVPTRELCVQVAEVLERLAAVRGLSVAAVYGGVPLRAQADRARTAHILVATPGRLQDLIDRRLVSLDAVTILVLDEADRMLDMGFKPQVDKIVRRIRDDRQTMFFSATLDGAVGELAQAYTTAPVRIEAELPSEHSTGEIDHQFLAVTAENKVDKLVELLNAERGLALVFVRTKRGADRLAQRLARHDVRAVAMHGDKTQAAREKALAHFESGKVTTLIATDVAARGLDLSDITHVINFDPPEDEKAYTHRVGRTGRAGRSGTGVTLVLPDQQSEVSRVARLNGQTEKWEETGMKSAAPKLVYSSKRRNSKWGPSRPRRKI